MEKFDPRLGTECVGCGNPATKYCDGWDTTKTNDRGLGSFAFGSQCGYPVCGTCTHVRGGSRQKHQPSAKR